MGVNCKVLKVLLNFFYLALMKNVLHNTYDNYKLWTVESVVHKYYESHIWRMLFMIITKILMKNVVHNCYENLNEEYWDSSIVNGVIGSNFKPFYLFFFFLRKDFIGIKSITRIKSIKIIKHIKNQMGDFFPLCHYYAHKMLTFLFSFSCLLV